MYSDDDTEIVYNYLHEQYKAKSSQEQPTLGTLFTKPYRKRFITGLAINILQQMSGVNFFIFYSTTIFNKISNNGDTVNFCMGIANFASSFIGMFFLKMFGRKTNLTYGIFIQGLCFWGMCMMFYFDNWTFILPASIIYILSFSLGMGGTSYPYVAEILPPIGVGIVQAVQWVFTATIGLLVPVLRDPDTLGILPLITFFTIMCVFGFFILDALIIETKGKSKAKIEKEFENLPWKFLR